MTLVERLADIRKRLDFLATIKGRPEDYQAVLVAIIRDCHQDGADVEREACARIASDEAQRLWKLATEEEDADRDRKYHTVGGSRAAKLVEALIRARSKKGEIKPLPFLEGYKNPPEPYLD